EDRDRHADFAFLVVDFLDAAVEVRERAFLDADGFANFEENLGTRFFHAFFHLGKNLFDFLFGDRGRTIAGAAEETRDAIGALDQVPGFVGEIHLDQDIARENATLGNRLATVLDFDDFLGGHENAAERILQPGTLDAFDQGLMDAFFHARIDMDDVPALAHAVFVP